MTPEAVQRVIVTRRLPEPVEALLRDKFGATLNMGDQPFSAESLIAAGREADVVLCTVGDRIPDAFFDSSRRARALVNFGVGVDHIPLDLARAAGVVVTNTPDVLTDDTADLAILLLLATMRRASEGERLLRSGEWRGWTPTQLLGTRLTGKTLGIVGVGRIGSAVARRAHAGFGMRIRYFARTEKRLDGVPLERCDSLHELLASCDAISLHVASTPETRALIGRRELALMRPGAVLVNTARGDIVDEAALIEALRSGRLAGAGLDVYAREPHVPAELAELVSVTLLPHLGSATHETREAMGRRAVANVEAILRGEPPPDRVA